MGNLLTAAGELDRREAWRSEGATSSGAWISQRLGVAEGTGRIWSHVAEKLWDLPHLAQGLRVGALSFDKVRAAVEIATPESDASVLRQAEECTVRQMTDIVRESPEVTDEQSESRHEYRYLRCNDARRSITAQLTEDAYALVRAAIAERARAFPSDGETPYDQRRADALVDICRIRTGRRGTGSGSADGEGSAGTADLTNARRIRIELPRDRPHGSCALARWHWSGRDRADGVLEWLRPSDESVATPLSPWHSTMPSVTRCSKVVPSDSPPRHSATKSSGAIDDAGSRVAPTTRSPMSTMSCTGRTKDPRICPIW